MMTGTGTHWMVPADVLSRVPNYPHSATDWDELPEDEDSEIVYDCVDMYGMQEGEWMYQLAVTPSDALPCSASLIEPSSLTHIENGWA